MPATRLPEIEGARIRIETEDFDVAAELAATRERLAGEVGAIASFVGLVRERFNGERVEELFLEHYPGMTEQSIAGMITDAQQRWALLDVLVIHRIGALHSADQIVYVQVASEHRPDAFAACEFLMDYLKTEAVLWKRERLSDAERWLESSADDARRRKAWESREG